MSAETLVRQDQMTPDHPLAGDVVPIDEIQVSPEQIESVVLQLQPRSEIDGQGLNRTIFEHGGLTFSFMGREETPDFPTLEGSKPTHMGRQPVGLAYLGEKPIMTPAKKQFFKDANFSDEQIKEIEEEDINKWQEDSDRLTSYPHKLSELRRKNESKPEHLLVEQSLYGLFALLEHFQPDNPHWKTQKESVVVNHYDDEALSLIDMITALNSASLKEGTVLEQRQEQPTYGEAVVLLAILGDKEAQRLAKSAATNQERQESDRADTAHKSVLDWLKSAEILKNVEAFKPKDLVVVHATSYEPKASDKGYEVQTTHDATGHPRATIHTSINHKVESHMWGNWDKRDFVLIAGFDQMLAADGPPSSINGADTYWTRNPGEPLIFPGATLIAPGHNQTDIFIRTDDGKILYRAEGYKSSDLESIEEQLGYGVRKELEDALHNDDDSQIDLDSPEGQQIAVNIIRDALVRYVIREVRGKELLAQSDDKFMTEETQRRVYKMVSQLGLGVGGGLHAESDDLSVEQNTALGERIGDRVFEDPRVRRVAYASGMMSAGGIARQQYLARRAYRQSGLD